MTPPGEHPRRARSARPGRFVVQAAGEAIWNRVPDPGGVEPSFLVLGNQKSGTSIVATAIARAADRRCQIDLPIERFAPTHLRRSPGGPDHLDAMLRRSARRLARPVVKEPSLTFWWRQLAARFEQAQMVFVVRDPFDNIRSILDRLGLDPSAEAGSLPPIDFPWLHLIELRDTPARSEAVAVRTLDEVVVNLATRWRLCAAEASAAAAEGHLVLRYEDFLADPVRSLGPLGLPGDPRPALERQVQPRGANRDGDPTRLLARWRTQIAETVGPLGARHGYHPEPNSS